VIAYRQILFANVFQQVLHGRTQKFVIFPLYSFFVSLILSENKIRIKFEAVECINRKLAEDEWWRKILQNFITFEPHDAFFAYTELDY
jgi:hypothetical protein